MHIIIYYTLYKNIILLHILLVMKFNLNIVHRKPYLLHKCMNILIIIVLVLACTGIPTCPLRLGNRNENYTYIQLRLDDSAVNKTNRIIIEFVDKHKGKVKSKSKRTAVFTPKSYSLYIIRNIYIQII